MTDDTLHCRCGREVRIVRLSRDQLALGHVTNPRNDHHYPRLARSAQAPAIVEDGGNPALTEGSAPASAVAVVRGAGPSSDPALPRGAARARASVPDHSSSPHGGRRARSPLSGRTATHSGAASLPVAAGRPDDKGRVAK